MARARRTAAVVDSRPSRLLFVVLHYSVVIAFVAIFVFFSLATPSFLTATNLLNVLVNNFTLLAVVSLGMTLVVATGGIDLSVGTAVDIGSMVFIMLMAGGYDVIIGVAGGLAGAVIVGAFNAALITRLRISPFLATLGTLFIGQSVQQLSTNGGTPIYLVTPGAARAFAAIGHGKIVGVPAPLWILAVCLLLVYFLLSHTRFGRYAYALGAQPGVAWYSGLRVRRDTAWTYILSALLCGVAGILLSSTVRSYVPLSGNAFLLDAIGATFIGTTLDSEGRPGVVGTMLGCLLLGMVKNGLLLIGWNFYWQQVGSGVLIFLVLALSFSSRRLRSAE